METAVKSVFARLEELDGQGYSAARYIASKVIFVLLGDHKRVYHTLQVLMSHLSPASVLPLV